jgi:hypothetical protein
VYTHKTNGSYVTNRKEAKLGEKPAFPDAPFISDGLEPFLNVGKHLQIVWDPFLFFPSCVCVWESYTLMCVYI